ncbi:MAG: DUF523 domain-containing protein [Ghiorsea sp.]|nr:DUF523 domain-containing protein [Ghiorsea sp.]MDQ7057668.1 DUF523 domain-containing protein [Ghiorsea sp.]
MSACLLGEAVRYDGGDCGHHLNKKSAILLQQWQQEGLLLSLCPEVSGGLPVPRPAAEIVDDKVVTQAGEDVSQAFRMGAEKALALCHQYQIQYAILKQGSPSCGNSLINDGSFSKTKVRGQGITARLLTAHHIQVFNETELLQLQILL